MATFLFLVALVEVLVFGFLVMEYRRVRQMQQATILNYQASAQKNQSATYALTVATTPELLAQLQKSR